MRFAAVIGRGSSNRMTVDHAGVCARVRWRPLGDPTYVVWPSPIACDARRPLYGSGSRVSPLLQEWNTRGRLRRRPEYPGAASPGAPAGVSALESTPRKRRQTVSRQKHLVTSTVSRNMSRLFDINKIKDLRGMACSSLYSTLQTPRPWARARSGTRQARLPTPGGRSTTRRPSRDRRDVGGPLHRSNPGERSMPHRACPGAVLGGGAPTFRVNRRDRTVGGSRATGSRS